MNKTQATMILEKARPFLDWLKNAESESEEESEDDAVEFEVRFFVSRFLKPLMEHTWLLDQ